MFLLVFISNIFASNYDMVAIWRKIPNVVYCENTLVSFRDLQKGIEYWKTKGYQFGDIQIQKNCTSKPEFGLIKISPPDETIEKDKVISAKGPIGKFFSSKSLEDIMKITGANVGDSIFLACNKKKELERITSLARDKIARELDLVDDDIFAFCWVVDYPMFERDEQTNKINFSHNPFSMPQGEVSRMNFEKPLDILAFQYDIVCNGIELSSGAIRNHIPELMYKLFSIAGYNKKQVDEKFSGMINALSYGAPPHGGIAPGIDRIIMLLANEKNIREVTMFPMNQNAEDLMMNAPSKVNENQLRELSLSLKLKK